MPDIYKTTWFFEGVQSAGVGASSAVGWTETWYQLAASVDQALSTALDQGARSFMSLRRQILARLYRVAWCRVSQVNRPGVAKVGRVDNFFGRANLAAQVTCAVLVDVERLPGVNPLEPVHTRRLILRGLPTSLIMGNVIDATAPEFPDLLNFLGYMARGPAPTPPPPAGGPYGNWLIRYFDPANVSLPISSLVVDPAIPRRINVAAPVGAWNINDRFNITGVDFPRGVNRIWTATAGGAPPLPINLGRSRFDIAGLWTSGRGRIRKVSYLYNAPDQYLLVGLRERKVGVPSRLTRGRRRVD